MQDYDSQGKLELEEKLESRKRDTDTTFSKFTQTQLFIVVGAVALGFWFYTQGYLQNNQIIWIIIIVAIILFFASKGAGTKRLLSPEELKTIAVKYVRKEQNVFYGDEYSIYPGKFSFGDCDYQKIGDIYHKFWLGCNVRDNLENTEHFYACVLDPYLGFCTHRKLVAPFNCQTDIKDLSYVADEELKRKIRYEMEVSKIK